MIDLPDVSIKKILYATDLSEHARHAFAWAISLAERYEASLSILYVMEEDLGLDDRVLGYVPAEQWDNIKKHHMDEARQALIGKQRGHAAIRKVLERFAENAASDENQPDFTTDEIIVDRGNPVEQILKNAEKVKADCIVIGSHGVSNLADAMMGSTAQKVMRRSKMPVMVVRLPKE